MSLLGYDLIPEGGVDVVGGNFVEVGLVDSQGTEYPCEVIDYWSNEENVYFAFDLFTIE